jgi:hypothetical protein
MILSSDFLCPFNSLTFKELTYDQTNSQACSPGNGAIVPVPVVHHAGYGPVIMAIRTTTAFISCNRTNAGPVYPTRE